ncbi:hypothetical protein BG015_009600 [Linnemannia schmuckeri]|uniref:VASt domain-containing protein n=1 Tax=Linnemannia schmuckeri TaxID=64567 RepID=A0A9P5VEB5_9FUNG|nr:hypothetical protein BG015_009600 [Linnemannia schmuckeri]
METIYDEESSSDIESSVASLPFSDRSGLMERSTTLPSFKGLKGRTPSFSTSWRPMTDADNIHNTHPIPNDTVPSVSIKQRLALVSPDLPGSFVCPPSSAEPHLATPPYSLPEWITDTKLDNDRHSRCHETLAPAARGRHDSQGSVGSFFGALHGQQLLSGRSKSISYHRSSSSSGGSADSHTSTLTLPVPSSQNKTLSRTLYNQELSAPIPIQPQPSSVPLRQQWRKAPTPPPSLLSPSLTTTKVSRSSSTIHGISGSSSAQSHALHTRKDDHSTTISSNKGSILPVSVPLSASVRSTSTAFDSLAIYSSQNQDLLEPKDVGAGPTNCRCTEHYRYAILSTVVPMPLDLCFEWLYSSQGFGHEDHLVRKAHAIVNSSLHIEISPWTNSRPETSTADKSEWETKRRELHYSVTFKIPMYILEHSAHSIRIHTESTTPNVLYGDMFSTVNQVCLTLESPGMTRIRCFAEVKFKKSILWGSRIEASAMQGCGSYYKELLRQLMDMEPTLLQQSHVVRPSVTRSNTTDSAQANQQLQYSSITANLAISNTTTSLEAAPVMTRSSSQGFTGVSPAHSLLAQQYLKNLPNISKVAQIPTTSTDLGAESISTSVTTTSITSADDITLAGSSKLMTVDRSAGFFWKSMVQTSVEFLTNSLSIIATSSKDQGTSPRGHDSHIQGDTDISSKGAPQDNNQSSTAVSSMDGSIRTVEADGSAQESTVTSASLDILSTVESDTDATMPRQPISPIQASSRALWLVLAIVMVMSVLNLWCLFRTVSSMANVIHNSRHARPSMTHPLYRHWLDRSECFHDGGIGSFQMFSTHRHSLPLHVQADMLRCEMDDLTHLLQIVQRSAEK